MDIYSCRWAGERFYILYEKMFSICEIDDELRLVCKYLVSDIPVGIFNMSLVQLVEIGEDCIILVSQMGDVFKVSNFLSYPYVHRTSFQPHYREEDDNLNSIKIIENNNEEDSMESQRHSSVKQL